jgi:hypothetical protein
MEKFEVGCVDQIGNVKFNLDIFEQTPSKSESRQNLSPRKC